MLSCAALSGRRDCLGCLLIDKGGICRDWVLCNWGLSQTEQICLKKLFITTSYEQNATTDLPSCLVDAFLVRLLGWQLVYCLETFHFWHRRFLAEEQDFVIINGWVLTREDVAASENDD